MVLPAASPRLGASARVPGGPSRVVIRVPLPRSAVRVCARPVDTTPPQHSGPAAADEAAPPRAVPRIAVGVDFGTSASGYAYALLEQPDSKPKPDDKPKIKWHVGWPDQPVADPKTRTALLYRGTNVEAWGWTAWKRYSEMSDTERRGGDYCYLEAFKLLLMDPPCYGQQQQVVVVGGVGPTLPKGLTATQVVADYLMAMRSYIYSRLSKADGGTTALDPSCIVWCLTVPAMWSEAAKAKMRSAAKRAGMATSTNPTALLIALEPEAAALAATRVQAGGGWKAATAPVAKAATPHGDAAAEVGDLRELDPAAAPKGGAAARKGAVHLLREGDVLLVLDCGGGTADITMHRVLGAGADLALEEAAVTKGVPAGGRFVDEAAWRCMREVVGAGPWDTWRAQQHREWTRFAERWEAAKRNTGPIAMALPPGLMDLMQQAGGPVACSYASLSRDGSSVVLSEEVLEQHVLGPVVDRVVAAAEEVLADGERNGSKCSKMLLAGGFANSRYLQRRVRQLAEERQVPLLLPPFPSAAVLSGAVIFGQRPSRVTARRSRLTYGISCRSLWTPEDALNNSLFGYPEKLWKAEDHEYYADAVFETYVNRGQLVRMDEVVKRTFCPTSSTTHAIGIDLYATHADSARYVAEAGMSKVAEVTLELPPGWSVRVQKRSQYDIEVKLRFGATEVTMVARDPRSKNVVATTVAWSGAAVAAK